MASLSLLLPFCQFMLHRLHTDNLELFERIVSEFLASPPCFDTVETMVRFSFPLVAILPVDNPDNDERARADAILLRMQQRHQEQDQTNSTGGQGVIELRAALETKVELKNWDWLEHIFDEFCIGVDHALREFATVERQAIAVMPMRPVGVSSTRRQLPIILPSIPSTVISSTSNFNLRAGMDARDARDPPMSPRHVYYKKAKRAPKKPAIEPADRRAVFEELLAVEAQAPWEAVFDVTNIEYPFDAAEHPLLAAALEAFWQRHAFAVWERMFWYQYGSPLEHVSRQEQRKARQDGATRSFETHVLVQVYETLGPDFFVDLDLRSEKHYWWWYRGPVIDILRLGKDKSIEYLRTRAAERFPNPPPGLELGINKHNLERSSMWAVLAKYKRYRDEMAKAKKARLEKGE